MPYSFIAPLSSHKPHIAQLRSEIYHQYLTIGNRIPRCGLSWPQFHACQDAIESSAPQVTFDIQWHGSQYSLVNSLTPGKFEWNFRHIIFKQNLVIDGWGISCEIALIWMSLDFVDDQSTFVQIWLGAIRQQAITGANVDPDLCRHMGSLGPNELTHWPTDEVSKAFMMFFF